jgi:hypothetical protein
MDAKGSAVLPAPECKRLLAVAARGDGVGRLGIATDDAPVIVPVNFSLQEGQVLIRVGSGFMSEAASGQLVAFEVDRVDRETGTAWSVLVRGLARLIESPSEMQLGAAHPLVPEPGDMVLMIRPDVLSGRRFGLRGTRAPSPQ